MMYQYQILFEKELSREDIFVQSVMTVKQSQDKYTFLDESENIVAMLKQELVSGIIRIEPEIVAEKEPVVETIQPIEPTVILPSKEIPKSEIVEDEPQPKAFTPFMRPIPEDNPRQGYTLQKNKETKGYEVRLNNVEALREIDASLATSASTADVINDETAHLLIDNQQEQIVEMTYKKIQTTGIYDPVSKIVLIEKGSLISKKETNSLRKSKSHGGIKSKRKTILRKFTKPYNAEFNILTEDIEFTSLHQACCVISGTIMSPAQYWRVVG